MTAAHPPGRVPDSAEGTIIPPQLVKLTAVLVDVGMKELARRNGAPPTAPGLPALRKLLAAGASAIPAAILETPSRAPFTTAEAATIMRISASRVRYLAASGRLIARKAGRDWLIDPDSVRDYRKGTIA